MEGEGALARRWVCAVNGPWLRFPRNELFALLSWATPSHFNIWLHLTFFHLNSLHHSLSLPLPLPTSRPPSRLQAPELCWILAVILLKWGFFVVFLFFLFFFSALACSDLHTMLVTIGSVRAPCSPPRLLLSLHLQGGWRAGG